MKERRVVAFDHLFQRKCGSQQSDVRLHVGIETVLAVGLFVDIQSIGYENPSVDIEVVHFDAFSAAKSHLELDGELVMYLGLYLNHGLKRLEKQSWSDTHPT